MKEGLKAKARELRFNPRLSVDEADTQFVALQLWGPLAKTMTEKAAWSLARDKELDMVVINPAIVLGPKVFGTTQSIFTYLKGKKKSLSNLAHN